MHTHAEVEAGAKEGCRNARAHHQRDLAPRHRRPVQRRRGCHLQRPGQVLHWRACTQESVPEDHCGQALHRRACTLGWEAWICFQMHL